MSTRPFIRTLLDFQRAFPDESACLRYLEAVRWPKGFVCPLCGAAGDPFIFGNRPRVRRCRSCQADISLTAGTIMHRTKMPLQVWFWAAYLMTSQTPGMSALQFRRQLGVSWYQPAFMMFHKLRAAMVNPNRGRIGKGKNRETGEDEFYTVEMDESYVGGRTRGKGRGVTEKVVVVGAIEVRYGKKEDPVSGEVKERRYAGRLRLRHVPDRGAKSLIGFAKDVVEPGTIITTDDWGSYDGLNKNGFTHAPTMKNMGLDVEEYLKPKTAREKAKERGEKLPLIHLIFSNLKAWILGTHHGVSPKHLQAYLNEFVFRFNRRFYPMSAFHSLLNIAVEVQAPEYQELYAGLWEHPNPAEWNGDET
jgi:transposase-like protein